jgi:hypothetical protein
MCVARPLRPASYWQSFRLHVTSKSLASDYRHFLSQGTKIVYVYSADFHPQEGFLLDSEQCESSNVIREGRFKRTIISGASAKEFFFALYSISCAKVFYKAVGRAEKSSIAFHAERV